MGEDTQNTITEVTNSPTKYRKIQNYSQFRSAENQRSSNHFTKPYLPTKKAINFNQSYTKNRSNDQNNAQEYHRFRNSTYHSPAQTYPFLYPCYSQLVKQNENEYSKYRDSRSLRTKRKYHTKYRDLVYDNKASRFPVPDAKVCWNIPFPDYMPVEYTTEKILHNPKADPSDPSSIDNFNQIGKKTDRRSFTGIYQLDPVTHRPQNPMGRTGMTGRGRLYYWGPNHAGDPVVTRWLRDENHSIIHRRKNGFDQMKPVLEFVAIRRRDNHQWALPGGMVDPGERVCQTIKREFQEEAVKDGVDKSCIDQLFSNGQKVYEYYVDDPRNTDNAWMETVAMNFHDETGQLTKNLHLDAGDDAEKAVWCPIDENLELHSCHKEIIKFVVDRLHAYW